MNSHLNLESNRHVLKEWLDEFQDWKVKKNLVLSMYSARSCVRLHDHTLLSFRSQTYTHELKNQTISCCYCKVTRSKITILIFTSSQPSCQWILFWWMAVGFFQLIKWETLESPWLNFPPSQPNSIQSIVKSYWFCLRNISHVHLHLSIFIVNTLVQGILFFN